MNAVRLHRTIDAAPGDVYRAWLDPELIARWMRPTAGQASRTGQASRAEVDERPGGHYRIYETEAGADVGGFDAEILDLDPGRRIVFRWGFVGPERRQGPAYDSLLTVTFAEASGGGTLLTLVHERLDELAAAMPEVAAQVEAGWRAVLGNLAQLSGAL